MAFTMHSHSGQFCPGHAKDQLEEVIRYAISRGYTTMGLTEHMPRTAHADLYPEELDDPDASLAVLFPRHAAYVAEAQRLRDKYADQIHLLVGFEGEWLRDEYAALVLDLASHEAVDYFIGSLHHVNGIPIDFDKAFYQRALESVVVEYTQDRQQQQPPQEQPPKPTEEQMYERYYDEQLDMLRAQKPRVVGHFDLIRLMSSQPDREMRTSGWAGVWRRILRNLDFVASYGGWLECNSAALRKGLAEPYPARDIAEEWVKMGGRFTLSDDSHGIAQIGTNYARTIAYLESLGVSSVWTFQRVGVASGGKKAELLDREVPLEDVKKVVSTWS
ncbi:Polymerase/histidinol phosphatase-like protein [Microdochium trichocladiopsis]|uniref:Histidinol-phosphatase n=1 Tax=Microdochium trichocladiopsis TaxID=1682393 RepID=A0A9P8Y783_9PEZI|nr:Polymerase/histidinol phosphatase-like protein [Microdochium trichocladiopsis]KAH7031420.1 Polymerase/histidinol phosphatase-like protein [Microdochium trichocladiopsis]